MLFRPRLRPVYLLLVVFMSLTAACSTLPPILPGPRPAEPEATAPPPTEPPPAAPTSAPAVIPEGTAPVTGTTTIQPSQTITESIPSAVSTAAPASATLTGQVNYLARIALSPNAVVEVVLQDISKADAPAVVIASQTIQTEGKQVPIPFTLTYDPNTINPAMRYAVSARITEDGKLTWISTQVQPVLTRGAPEDDVEIVVYPVRN